MHNLRNHFTFHEQSAQFDSSCTIFTISPFMHNLHNFTLNAQFAQFFYLCKSCLLYPADTDPHSHQLMPMAILQKNFGAIKPDSVSRITNYVEAWKVRIEKYWQFVIRWHCLALFKQRSRTVWAVLTRGVKVQVVLDVFWARTRWFWMRLT